MQNKTARVLAIIALVFMAVFVVTLVMTVVDHTMLHGSIGFIALGSGVFVLVVLIALKADGRGYSLTKINNEIEMAKIQKELEEKEAAEKELAEKAEDEKPDDEKSDDDKSEDEKPDDGKVKGEK